MAAATAAEQTQMARALSGLEAQLRAAEKYAEDIASGWFVTDAQRSVLKNVADERTRFNTWRNVWRSWAIAGVDPTGRGYAVTFWLRIGNDIASALKTYTGALYNADLFTVIKDSLTTPPSLPPPSQWPTWAKVLAAVGVAGVVVVTISNVATIARAFRG
ncbi:hypothetical protein [Hyalangium sp.]|uniref:hypothetical protein n=1 Tax=Hyalangium sp. TaxID=2028555 RepID=UPI002D24FBAB|nr:hypothetical protein [Hyalangium sp.]HYI00572.1 hypothetical protein [Hyalangium sp.]